MFKIEFQSGVLWKTHTDKTIEDKTDKTVSTSDFRVHT